MTIILHIQGGIFIHKQELKITELRLKVIPSHFPPRTHFKEEMNCNK
jgi:hypothetical protein